MATNRIKNNKIIHPLYGSIKPLGDNEKMRDMESNGYKLSKRPKKKIVIIPPVINMKTVDYKMNFKAPFDNMKNEQIFNLFTVSEKIKTIETKINNKSKFKTIDPEFKSKRTVLGSQITFHVGQFKIKLFNILNGICTIQIPGVTDETSIEIQINILRNELNKMLKTDDQTEIVSAPYDHDIKGFSAKCVLQLEKGHSVNFKNLFIALNEVKDLQHASFIRRNDTNSNLSSPCSDEKNNLSEWATSPLSIDNQIELEPVERIIWPIYNIDGMMMRKKCNFHIYTPIINCDFMQKVRIDINSKEKNIEEHKDTSNYSIIIAGRCQMRQLRYIYYFLWEFFIKYEDQIIYKESEYVEQLKENQLESDRFIIKNLENKLFGHVRKQKESLFDI